MTEKQKEAIKKHGQLKGKTVKSIVEDCGASGMGVIYGIEFSDGTNAWIQRDEEGNGAGFFDIQK